MRREDEYKQLANNVRKRAGDEESALMRAQWEILAGTYVRLADKKRAVSRRRSMTPARMANQTFSFRTQGKGPSEALDAAPNDKDEAMQLKWHAA